MRRQLHVTLFIPVVTEVTTLIIFQDVVDSCLLFFEP